MLERLFELFIVFVREDNNCQKPTIYTASKKYIDISLYSFKYP